MEVVLQELIGNVRLNLDYYEGKDLYSEGTSEDELLDIVKSTSTDEYNAVINERKSWSMLYHLSNIRENIVSFLPITKNDSVLEIGSGCGAITGKLADMAGSVTCIELSKKRSTINAYRNKEKDNIEILVGNFQTIEKKLTKKYDYITLIGVFEYAASYIKSESDAYSEFMKIVAEHLNDNGKLVIAIENKYGMKYFAGCREDHVGLYFEGIEGYANTNIAKTFSRDRMLEYAANAGLEYAQCYYPYPDYKLPMAIYSDEFMPVSGELLRIPAFNFDQSRYVLFNDAKALEEAVKEHAFGTFANSFLFVFKKQQDKSDRTIYVKYSNERAKEFMIRTEVCVHNRSGEYEVYKAPESKESTQHIKALYDNYIRLSNEGRSLWDDIEAGTRRQDEVYKVEYNKCHMDGCKACFEYIQGKSLGQTLCEMYKEARQKEAEELMSRYIRTIRHMAVKPDMEKSQQFIQIFGDIDLNSISTLNKKSMPITDIDFNLDNIFWGKDSDTISVIDYEWVFDFDIPVGYIIYRVLKYLCIDIMGVVEEYKRLLSDMCERHDISETEAVLYEQMDESFGIYVRKGRSIMGELSVTIGKDRIVLNDASISNLLMEKEHAAALKEYCDAYELKLADRNDKIKKLEERCAAHQVELEKIKNSLVGKVFFRH